MHSPADEHDQTAPENCLLPPELVASQRSYNATGQTSDVIKGHDEPEEAGARIFDRIEKTRLSNQTT